MLGVPLNHLVGKRFRVGDVVLFGGRLNFPCKYLEKLLGLPVEDLDEWTAVAIRMGEGGEARMYGWCGCGVFRAAFREALPPESPLRRDIPRREGILNERQVSRLTAALRGAGHGAKCA